MKRNPWTYRKNLFSSPVPKVVQKPKMKWKVLPIIWMALKKTCAVIGAVVLFSAFFVMWSFSSVVEDTAKPLPNKMVLRLTIDGELGEVPDAPSFGNAFESNSNTVKNFIDALYKAKHDPRVAGVYAEYAGGVYALNHIQDIRKAVKDFRESGKFAYFFAPSMDGGLGIYYLASAFDEIWLQPVGNVAISGVNAEIPFFREVLDKIGIEPQFFQRKEYKSAYESLSAYTISEANKESLEKLVADLTESISQDLTVEMGISAAEFKSLVDHGLYLDKEAKEAGLVDVVDYQDVLFKKINELTTGDPDDSSVEFIDLARYIQDMIKFKSSGSYHGFASRAPDIALIYAVGAIVDSGEGVAAADEISEALLEAAGDDAILAVVLRVDSPGGSPVASETILRAVEKVKEAGKPIIVSMGSAAASGGYWISAYADYIFAAPTTLTGSIGVLGGKVSAKELWSNLGVNWDRVQWGKNSGIWSMNTPFSTSEAERMNAMLDNIYDNFLMRVSKGRDIPLEQVEKIARGRVWSGQSALKIGLVDQLGSLDDALDYAAQQIGEKNRNTVHVRILPKPLTPIEKLVQLLEGQVKAGQIIGAQAKLIEMFIPVFEKASVLQNAGAGQVYSTVPEIIE